MYNFVTGPLAWLSFAVFFIGVIAHVVLYIRGLDWKIDRVTYSKNVKYGIIGAVRSVFFWMLPFGTRSWRVKPGVTLLVFVLHFGVLFTPIFLSAHNILLQESWGFSLPAIPDGLADFLTVAVMVSALLLLVRRMALPEVRLITDSRDLLMILITVAPFVTGYMAYHQVADSQAWLIAHILTGELMLVAIPFTKLSHFILFFCSRVQVGMDFGIKRGGMKSSGLDW